MAYRVDQSGPAGAPATLTVEEAHTRARNGTLTLIDVRRADEWQRTGRPEGSYGATLQDLDFVAQVEAIVGGDRARPIAMTCATGNRSGRAAQMLSQEGFENVANVAGGIADWTRKGLPVETAPFKR